MSPLPCVNLSITIHKPYIKVYDFLADPMNFPLWASGLAKGLKKWGHVWMAETDNGMMKVKFSERNEYGIVDHSIFLSAENEIRIPMRVLINKTGSEVLFTLFRQPDMNEEKFAADIGWVEKDLKALKTLLEGR
ncbi:MAG: SRPBCC family protein [Chitinophagaceae bacterium]|nr:SRPBCC family protein [Oligoflexus sp.]